MSILIRYLSRYSKLVFLALLLAAINQVFSLLDPLIFRHIVDDYASHYKDFTLPEFLKGVGTLLACVVGTAFVSRTAKNIQDYYVNVVTQKVGVDMYCDGLAHSLELPYSVFEDQQSGETLGRLQKVRADVEKLIAAVVNTLYTTLIGFVFVIVYSFQVHWMIVPVYGLTVPLIAFVSMRLSRRFKTVQQAIVRETTALSGTTTESLRNIELVKSLGLADQEINRLNNTTARILELELKKIRYVRSLSFVQGTVINFVRTCILFLMLYWVFLEEITFGQFFSLYFYSFFLFGPLQELGTIIALYREAEASLQNFTNILNQAKEPQPEKPKKLERLKEIEFRDVGFRYGSATRSSLENISFHVRDGETIAFVGPSGSGKSTLVKLLVGLYHPNSGTIRYNGIGSQEIDPDELRGQLGIVTQETQLFAGTIRENIRFVKPQATEEECLDALHKSACAGLLSRAEKGIDTLIGEGGVKVSGGERQRLSIARALLRKPSLLVFDEATSALDSLTEDEISHTIREVSKTEKQITILIAHRLSTIFHADRIYVLEHGSIVESGAHEELLALRGLYYALWRQQIGSNERERKQVGA